MLGELAFVTPSPSQYIKKEELDSALAEMFTNPASKLPFASPLSRLTVPDPYSGPFLTSKFRSNFSRSTVRNLSFAPFASKVLPSSHEDAELDSSEILR